MSEYWKSTPKYWCKHCKVYVRDTKLERTNHDATPRHQGNLKRFLRDLHRDHEKGEKDKERAKAEIARLNGVVTGGSGGTQGESSKSGSGDNQGRDSNGFYKGPTAKPQATAAQRKAQLEQLAEMGVSIPDEYRGGMAMAGEWQVTATRVVDPEEGKEKKPEAIGFGVHKRLAPGEEDEEGEMPGSRKRKWGTSYRRHPDDKESTDLDALLSTSLLSKTPADVLNVKQESVEVKKEDGEEDVKDEVDVKAEDEAAVKREPLDELLTKSDPTQFAEGSIVKQEDGQPAGGVVFKKRKAKNIRQKE